MFSRIEIERFRSIRYARIEGFKQINLFFGKNNCGKFSLLESLFLVSGLSNPLLPMHINIMRGYSKSRLEDLKFDFKIDGQSFVSQLRFDTVQPNKAKRVVAEQYEESLHCTYLSPKYGLHLLSRSKRL